MTFIAVSLQVYQPSDEIELIEATHQRHLIWQW